MSHPAFSELLHTATARRKAALRVRKLRLSVMAGPDAGKSFDFDRVVRIGSRELADLVLTDRKVSGLHCEIVVGEELRLRDLGSKNGVRLDLHRVYDAQLTLGGVFMVGSTSLCVQALDEETEVRLHPSDEFFGIVGSSTAIRELTSQVERLAQSDLTVLVQGETGAGKEGIAQALHRAGPRAQGPFIVIDCGAIVPTLVEAELFGYERGAFTGANARHVGAFENANGGTLFLDEIGELPLALQPKLLRALQSKRFRRVGGSTDIAVDLRVVAATNRDLAREAAEGRFREDLYYRLTAAVLRVPPLRERTEDILPIAVQMLRDLGVDPATFLTREALTRLERHPWRGNVRELRNTLERAAAFAAPIDTTPPATDATPDAIDLSVPLIEGKRRLVDRYEREYIGRLLELHEGRVKEAAAHAGIDRVSLYRIQQRIKRAVE